MGQADMIPYMIVMSQMERKLEKDKGNYKELEKTLKDLFMKGLREGYKLAQILKEE